MFNIILIIIILLNFNLYAGIGTEGTTGMLFLNISPDAGGGALSDSVIGDARGVRSIYYNPAGLNFLVSREILLSYTKWVADMNYFYAGFATSQFKKILKGNAGISITFMDEGKVSNIGIEDTANYSLTSSDVCITFAYARTIRKFNLGANLKFVNKSIFGESSTGMALDVGAQLNFSTVKGEIDLGAVLKNIGFASATVNESDLMPMKLQLGGNYNYKLKKKNMVKALVGIDILIDDLPVFNLGIEYGLKSMLFLRTGYRLATGFNRIEKYNGLSFGMGIVSKKLSIDFSIIPMGVLGNNIMVTAGIKF